MNNSVKLGASVLSGIACASFAQCAFDMIPNRGLVLKIGQSICAAAFGVITFDVTNEALDSLETKIESVKRAYDDAFHGFSVKNDHEKFEED